MIILRIFLLVFVVAISSENSFAQKPKCEKYDWKRGLIRGSAFIIPGITKATHEVLLNRYYDFNGKFPNANDGYWNPEISWQRKYENPYPLAEHFPAFTDGHHLLNFIHTNSLVGAVTLTFGEKRKWWHYALDIGIGMAYYGAASNLTYYYFTDKF
jgi:hypothetical protein